MEQRAGDREGRVELQGLTPRGKNVGEGDVTRSTLVDPVKYSTQVIDPPWKHDSPGWRGSAKDQYDVVPLEALEKLPVSDLAADDAHLWVWTTDEHLAVTHDLIDLWGFTKKAIWPWTKICKHPVNPSTAARLREEGETLITYRGEYYKRVWPKGYYGRVVHEYVIFASRGKNLTRKSARNTHRHLVAPWTGRHSEKPDAAYDLFTRFSPGPRLNMFARKIRPGFDAWGDEVKSRRIPLLDSWSAEVKREGVE